MRRLKFSINIPSFQIIRRKTENLITVATNFGEADDPRSDVETLLPFLSGKTELSSFITKLFTAGAKWARENPDKPIPSI